MKAIVFDIDGTLADNSHRLHFIQQEPKDWNSFFEECDKDGRINPVINLLNILLEAHFVIDKPTFDFVFCTGRPERTRDKTQSWLRSNLFISDKGIHLYMRKDGDYRPDDVVKAELIDKMRVDGFDPYIVFDDRKRVVDMWRRHGITCLQCAEGDF